MRLTNGTCFLNLYESILDAIMRAVLGIDLTESKLPSSDTANCSKAYPSMLCA